jgi:hypothetical protein
MLTEAKHLVIDNPTQSNNARNACNVNQGLVPELYFCQRRLARPTTQRFSALTSHAAAVNDFASIVSTCRFWRFIMIITRRVLATLTAVTCILCGALAVQAQSRVSIGVTETIETHNPYGDSVSLQYGIYSEVTGPFCTPKVTSKGVWPSAGKSKIRRPGFFS